MDTTIKDIYKIYQLMEFFVIKHNYSNIMIKGLSSKNEVWLINRDNPSFNIIRISLSTLDETFSDNKRLSEYLKVMNISLGKKVQFLDIHISNEIPNTENFETVCLNTNYASGIDIEPFYPGLKYVIHDVDNPESEIASRVESINANMKTHVRQKRRIWMQKMNCSCTLVIIGLCVLNYIASLFLSYRSDSITSLIALGADYKFFTLGLHQYWRLFTYAFCHNGLIHLVMNMYSLYILGNYFENKYGPIKYLSIIIFSILGSSLVYGILSGFDNTVCMGMSGAIYSLFAIYVIEAISLGALNNSRFVFLILVNLGLNFVSGVAWQAHLGGALIGLLFYYMFKDNKVDYKITALVFVLFMAIGYKYVSNNKIEPLYLGTDQAVVKLYNDIGLNNYANKLELKIYNYYINIE